MTIITVKRVISYLNRGAFLDNSLFFPFNFSIFQNIKTRLYDLIIYIRKKIILKLICTWVEDANQVGRPEMRDLQ